MVVKKLIDSIQDDWKTEYDEQIFALLLRTLKETGYICKYDNFSVIVSRCYWSRNNYVLENHAESLWKNISLWINDITKSESGMKGNIDSFDRLHLSFMWRINLINKIFSKYNINDTQFFYGFFGIFSDWTKYTILSHVKKHMDLDKVNCALDYCSKILIDQNWIKIINDARINVDKVESYYGNTKNN